MPSEDQDEPPVRELLPEDQEQGEPEEDAEEEDGLFGSQEIFAPRNSPLESEFKRKEEYEDDLVQDNIKDMLFDPEESHPLSTLEIKSGEVEGEDYEEQCDEPEGERSEYLEQNDNDGLFDHQKFLEMKDLPVESEFGEEEDDDEKQREEVDSDEVLCPRNVQMKLTETEKEENLNEGKEDSFFGVNTFFITQDIDYPRNGLIDPEESEEEEGEEVRWEEDEGDGEHGWSGSQELVVPNASPVPEPSEETLEIAQILERHNQELEDVEPAVVRNLSRSSISAVCIVIYKVYLFSNSVHLLKILKLLHIQGEFHNPFSVKIKKYIFIMHLREIDLVKNILLSEKIKLFIVILSISITVLEHLLNKTFDILTVSNADICFCFSNMFAFYN